MFVMSAALLLGVSCESDGDKLNREDLPDPLKINLRSNEVEMVKSDQLFAFDFFTNIFKEEMVGEDENFMVSPLSLSMALAMTWNGASGETKIAMQRVLRLDGYSEKEVNQYYRKLREALLKTDPSTKMAIANSIWTNQNVKIKEDFIQTNREYFNSTVESVDFAESSTVDRINRWAADNTNELIDHVLDETNPMSLMYLLNAIYFKGIWSSQFEKKNSSKRLFTYENGTEKRVDMMHQKSEFNYCENQIFQMVQLPYGNQAFSMMVLLPQKGKKLIDVIDEIGIGEGWNSLRSELRSSEVDLYLPKFKTKYNKRLNDALINMGMEIAFNPQLADFSSMSDFPAFISFVDQFTYIATDEVGTEAAAVTVVAVELTAYKPPAGTVLFDANRPFIYIIEENSTGSILFMGVVKNFD